SAERDRPRSGDRVPGAAEHRLQLLWTGQVAGFQEADPGPWSTVGILAVEHAALPGRLFELQPVQQLARAGGNREHPEGPGDRQYAQELRASLRRRLPAG